MKNRYKMPLYYVLNILLVNIYKTDRLELSISVNRAC